MRIFKRGLATLLALLMLMMSFPTGVFAIEYTGAVELTLDEPNSFWAGSEGGTSEQASFTPSESGLYTFRSFFFIDATFRLYDSEENVIAEDDPFNRSFFITWHLEAGETYYLRADWGDAYTNGQIDLVVSRCPIEAIEFHDLKIVEGYNCSETSYNDPDTGEYKTYRIYDYTPTYTVELSDGSTVDGSGNSFEIDGIEYYLTFADDQVNHVNTWEIGEHMVTATFFGMSDAFTVEIVDCPVVSVEVESKPYYEYITGYWRSDFLIDPDTGEEYQTDEYFVYPEYPDKFIITMNDGDTCEATGANPWFEWYGVSYDITCNGQQDYDTRWSVGTKTCTGEVMGFDFEYEVEVAPNPVASVEIEDLLLIEHADGWWDYEYVTDPDTGDTVQREYFTYSVQPKNYTITMVDGSVYTNSGVEWDGDYFYLYADNIPQSYGNELQRGTYQNYCTFAGKKYPYTIQIIDTPIQEVIIDPIVDIENLNGYQNEGSYFDDDGNEVEYNYFHYYSEPSEYTIVLKDGTRYENEGFYWNGEWYYLSFVNTQSHQNPWGLGDHEVAYTIAGYEDTYTVSVIENPIVSIVANDTPQNIAGLTGYEAHDSIYDEDIGEWVETPAYWFYDNLIPDSFTVTMRDGSTQVVTEYLELNGSAYYCNVGDSGQSYAAPWGVGTHTMTASLAGFAFTYEVEVVESPVVSVEVPTVELRENIDGYWRTDSMWDDEGSYIGESDRYFYYNDTDPRDVVITLVDGSVIEGNGFEWNGNWHYLEWTINQDYDNQWGVGAHEISASIAGYEFTYTVMVGASPLDRIEIHNAPIQLLENGSGYWTSDSIWDENGDYVGETDRYFVYEINCSSLMFTAYMTDGSTISVDGDGGFSWNGERYDIYFEMNQDYENQWGVGTRTVTATCMGKTLEVEVEVVESPIESVEVVTTPRLENCNGYLASDSMWDENGSYIGETEKYYRYDVNVERYIVTLKDGTTYENYFEWNGVEYYLNYNDPQTIDNQWGVGLHEVQATIAGFPVTFTVEVEETPVQSVQATPATKIENINGTVTRDWYENEYGEEEPTPEYFCYDMALNTYTITLKNGEVYENECFVWNNQWYDFTYLTEQTYETRWGVGEHTVQAQIAGFAFEYTVNVIESPVESVQVNDVSVIQGTQGYYERDEYWDEENFEWIYSEEYFRYHNQDPVNMVIALTDGTVVENTWFEWEGETYSIDVTMPVQTYENQLTIGTYPITATIAGYDFTYNLHIIDSPVESVVIDPMYVMEGQNCYQTTDSIYDEHGDYIGETDPYYVYYTHPTNYTITLQDGSVYKNSDVEWNDNWYSLSIYDTDQNYDNQWGIGTYEVRGSVAGYEFTYQIEIIDSLVESVEVSDVYYKVGGGYYIRDDYYNEDTGSWEYSDEYCYYEANPTNITITLVDGTVVRAPRFQWNGRWYHLEIEGDEQSFDNQWDVGSYEIEATIAGYDFIYRVYIVEPVSNDEYEYFITEDGVIITDCYLSDETLEIPDAIDDIPVTAIQWLGSRRNAVKHLVVPDSVQTVEPNWLNSFPSLQTLTIGAGVRNLEAEMFSNVSELTAITVSEDNPYFCNIGGGVYNADKDTFIAYPAAKEGLMVIPKTVIYFDHLQWLRVYKDLSIIVEDGHPDYVSIGLVTYTKDMETVMFGAKSMAGDYDMPDSVTDIENEAFYGVDGLESVVVSSQVTDLAYAVFANCSGLEQITLPDGLVSIYGRALAGTTSLTAIDLPDTLEHIDSEAFMNSGLTSITVPDSVEEIGYRAFFGSENLAEIDIPNDLRFMGSNAFGKTAWYNAQNDGVVYLEHIAYGYKGEMPPNTTVEIKAGTKAIANGAFRTCGNITKLVLPEGLTTIGEEAFWCCSGLTQLVVPSTVTYIDMWAFGNCAFETVYFMNEEQLEQFAYCFGEAECKVLEVAITEQPANAYAADGDKAQFSVEAIGADLTYQWQIKTSATGKWTNTTTAGYNTDTITVSAEAKRHGYQYRCVVSCGDYEVISDAAALSVLSITEQSASTVTAKDGENVSVEVFATGDNLTYTWYYKNAAATKFTKTTAFDGNEYVVEMNADRTGRQVYCVISDQHGNEIRSNTVTLGMEVAVTTQPKTTYAKDGATAKLTVKATGDGLKYTWYIKNAGATKYSKSSITTSTYSVKMSDAVKGRYVYCVVTDKYGKTVKSTTVVLRMAATITTQPKTTYVKDGETAKVTVKAKGDGLKYTWYIKNAGATKYSKSSITTSTYSVKMSDAVKGRYVYCVVTDKYGKTVKSTTVVLRMAATITTQPKNTTVANGTTAKVTVKAKGDGLKYTWYIKNAGATKYSKSSITTSTYSVKMSNAVNGRYVYCVVTDKYGKTVKSTTVVLRKK